MQSGHTASDDTATCITTGIENTIKTLSLLLLLAIAFQLPVAWLHWAGPGFRHALNIAAHGAALILSYRFIRQNQIRAGRRVLVLSLLSYLILANLIWPAHLGLHYYFLVAIIILPFLYAPWEARSVWFFCALLAGCFIAFDKYALFSPALPLGSDMRWLQTSNTWMLLACVLCSTYIVRRHTCVTWVSNARYGAKMTDWLHRVLPHRTRQILASQSPISPVTYRDAVVLIADMQGFTRLAARLSHIQVCDYLAELYAQFDALCTQHDVQKIKTNGDEYIAVAGLEQSPGAAFAACKVALGMQAEFRRRMLMADGDANMGLRIGIATGDICAGVQVQDFYRFDVWGDTVNLAAELEATCQSGKVQICETTKNALLGRIQTENRGTIPLKSRSPLPTYWLSQGNP